MVPRTVLTRSCPISVNTLRPVNTVQSRTTVNNAGPMKNVINNAYLTARRTINKTTTTNNSNFTKKVNTVKETRVNTARPKAIISAVKGNKGNAVKASTCWVWRPKHKILDHVSRNNGFIAFGGNSKEGKITGKGKIKTGKLDFEDVYFVKELKFNLFSVSQMCDKKNSVLFTDTECVVQSPDFKLTDESHVLLKVPRKDNMYSVDLNNVVPQGGLTCLFTKATPDESNLWHRRLGHVKLEWRQYLAKIIFCNQCGLLIYYSLKNHRVLLMLDSNLQEKMKGSSTVNAAGTKVNAVDLKTSNELPNYPNTPELEDIVYSDDNEDVGAEANMNNLNAFILDSPIPTARIHKDHPVEQIIRDLNSTPQTRRMTKNLKEHGLNKAILVAQWYTQEDGIYYDEVFGHVAKIEAIRLFLAYASFKDFMVYQMDVKSDFLYGKIEKEVYVYNPPRFEDLDFPDRVYEV
ncbi:ribonuclease H-like domain-containing protein [Tanacetum coccineum]